MSLCLYMDREELNRLFLSRFPWKDSPKIRRFEISW